MKEKVDEICGLIPAFNNEIDRTKGKTQEGKDYARYVFKNGSYFDNIAARETSRGKRRHGGVIEECVGVDGKILSEVIIPTMNVSRMCMDGSTHPEEQLNKSQLYITTAGYKNTYSYDKLIQFLVWSIVKPEKAMIMGGTYRIPVLVKLLDKNFVADLRMDGTFNESSFAREYSLYDLYSLNIVNCGKPNFYQKNGNPQPSLLIRGRFNDYAALMQSLAQYGIIMKGCYYFGKYKNK